MHHHQHYHQPPPPQPPGQPPEQLIHQPAGGVLGENHDHNQTIEQVINLENDFSDNTHATSMMDADSIYTPSINQQQQQQQPIQHQPQHHHHPQQQQQQQQHQQQASMSTDLNSLANDVAGPGGLCGLGDSNQLSTSSEDLLNLLLEFDREPSAMLGIETDPQDEKVGIETIRKQLMSCEVQSDQQNHHTHQQQAQIAGSMSSMINHNSQQANIAQQQQHQQQLVSQQSAPVIPSTLHQQHQQLQQTSIPSTSASQMNSDQNMLHSSYSNVSMSPVPISSSGPSQQQQQQYHTTQQQQHQHVARISQSNPMSIVSNSPSPSWQQPQLSPYSPHSQQHQQQQQQQQHNNNNTRTPSQRQTHPLHQNQPQQHQLQNIATSPQMQQLQHQQQNNPLQQRSPGQSVSPPATTEPSLVVKKNPLLNAQLINSRAPSSITPTRFVNSQQTTTSVLNQNPILNAKLSQSPFVTNSSATISSPVNPSLDPQARFMQQQQPTQQTPNFNYDITQQQHQNAQQQQQHTSQQSVNVTLYGHSDQQQHQSTNQIFRSTSNSVNDGGVDSMSSMGNKSPSGGLSQQVKQEIRKKVQQPKQQQHQTTSLLKQLLSDDNK